MDVQIRFGFYMNLHNIYIESYGRQRIVGFYLGFIQKRRELSTLLIISEIRMRQKIRDIFLI